MAEAEAATSVGAHHAANPVVGFASVHTMMAPAATRSRAKMAEAAAKTPSAVQPRAGTNPKTGAPGASTAAPSGGSHLPAAKAEEADSYLASLLDVAVAGMAAQAAPPVSLAAGLGDQGAAAAGPPTLSSDVAQLASSSAQWRLPPSCSEGRGGQPPVHCRGATAEQVARLNELIYYFFIVLGANVTWFTDGSGGGLPGDPTVVLSARGNYRWKWLARLDFYRGLASDDWGNEEWAALYALCPAAQILGNPWLSTESRGNVMEAITGAAFAAATEGRHLPQGTKLSISPDHACRVLIAIFSALQSCGVQVTVCAVPLAPCLALPAPSYEQVHMSAPEGPSVLTMPSPSGRRCSPCPFQGGVCAHHAPSKGVSVLTMPQPSDM